MCLINKYFDLKLLYAVPDFLHKSMHYVLHNYLWCIFGMNKNMYIKKYLSLAMVVTGITGISDETVQPASSFQESCGPDFIKFLRDY